MTVYDFSQVLVALVRLFLVLIGGKALWRIARNKYESGDYTRFSLGVAAFATVNATAVRMYQGYQQVGTEGTHELIGSNIFYVIVVSILAYFVLWEKRAHQ